MTGDSIPTDNELGLNKTVFVVSPIGSKLQPLGSPGRSRYEDNLQVWADVIEPACAQFGLTPVRADKISDPGDIPDQIFQYLRDADVVIADLSHGNANVMYELGLRHARSGITLQIGEYDRLPFDVQTIRTIQFLRTEAGLISVRNELVSALRAGLSAGATPLRATEVMSQGDSIPKDRVEADVAASKVASEDAGEDSPGILEVAAEGELAMQHINEVLNDVAEIMAEYNELSAALVDEMHASDKAGKGFVGRLVIAKKFDEVFTDPVRRYEERANAFYDDAQRIDGLVRWSLSRLEEDPVERAGSPEYGATIVGLIDASEEGAVGIVSLRDSARQLRKLSVALKNTSLTIERSANRLLEAIALMSAWRTQAERVRDLSAA